MGDPLGSPRVVPLPPSFFFFSGHFVSRSETEVTERRAAVLGAREQALVSAVANSASRALFD
jgi:hypothetical protein